MLERCYVNPVLPAQDGARAGAFYRDVLGLPQRPSPIQDPMLFDAGDGSSICVTEIPERTPPGYPTVSFTVTGIEELVAELTARGATFLTPGRSSFQGQDGAVTGVITDYGAVKSAFVVDSEGNVLALNEIIGF
ncbi:MAG TPA: VOC family protein [Mycobacteriales bacterium]|jgi:predicted enzyme related to lactoylglutathione lyase|nr:VOC family protein [Mycobacteriales bacterium]